MDAMPPVGLLLCLVVSHPHPPVNPPKTIPSLVHYPLAKSATPRRTALVIHVVISYCRRRCNCCCHSGFSRRPTCVPSNLFSFYACLPPFSRSPMPRPYFTAPFRSDPPAVVVILYNFAL